MALMTALLTGLQGLKVHTRKLDVIGNNIANVNTTSFKSSRMMFENSISKDIKIGSLPDTNTGGTNPLQIGLGVQIASVQRDFSTGSLNATGDPRDLAIDGNGFFIIDREGTRLYTRAGAFRQDGDDDIVTSAGEKLMGYGVDSKYNIQEGELRAINIPLGKMRIAEATTEASLAGNLNTDGDLSTTGSQTLLMANANSGFVTVSSASPAPEGSDRLGQNTKLIDIQDPAVGDDDTPLFQIGQSIQLIDSEKGFGVVPTRELAITASTTVQAFMDFLNSALGIQLEDQQNPDSSYPGVSLDTEAGIISITGNTGSVNDINIEASDIRLVDENGEILRQPFSTLKTTVSDGESVRTTLVVYDTLGGPVSVDVSLVLETKADTGTTWRYYVDANDSQGSSLDVSTGTIDFDFFGRLLNDTPVSISLTRTETGAVTPLVFDISFTGDAGRTTALADRPSQLLGVFRNGLPAGTLEAFSVQENGVVLGAFDNGALRTLGQVVLAKAPNPGGMVDAGGNSWQIGPNSGIPAVVIPGESASGSVISGALELSNVDLGQEFIDLITTSTGYSASSRIIRTADELMQQLLVLGR
jgi:flagellar hook protein FlgE